MSQTYQCQNRGCLNGFLSDFEKAEETWFRERGLSLPSNCPYCKDWKDAQSDEALRCTGCRRAIRVSANRKKSHYKSVGPWENPKKCLACSSGISTEPRSRLKRDGERQESDRQKRTRDFHSLPVSGFSLISLSTEVEDYQHFVLEQQVDGNRVPVSRREHIEHHLPGSAHDATTQDAAQARSLRVKSPSAVRAASFDGFLSAISLLLSNVDESNTRQYEKGSRIVRLNLLPGEERIEVVFLERHLGGHRLVTSYDNTTVSDAKGLLRKGWA